MFSSFTKKQTSVKVKDKSNQNELLTSVEAFDSNKASSD